jgi:enoyl-CoA hydratase/carnithine racemase
VVARRRLDGAALALARDLATRDPALVLAVRRSVRAAHDLGLEAALTLERRLALGLQGRP